MSLKNGTPLLSFRRYSLLLACCCLLAACGFRPMYGVSTQGASNVTELSQVAVGNIPDRVGQDLRNRLIDRLYMQGRPASPLYTLTLTPLQESRSDLDITKSSDATRAQLRLYTTMTLRRAGSTEALLTRDLSAITSYNVLQSQFTTRVAEDYARSNALEDLARQVESQLLLYFSRD